MMECGMQLCEIATFDGDRSCRARNLVCAVGDGPSQRCGERFYGDGARDDCSRKG